MVAIHQVAVHCAGIWYRWMVHRSTFTATRGGSHQLHLVEIEMQ